jgi:transcriptional regulator with XRE-family HTH domain
MFPSNDPMSDRAKVQAILDYHGWTQYELAKRSSIPQQTINSLMNGNHENFRSARNKATIDIFMDRLT